MSRRYVFDCWNLSENSKKKLYHLHASKYRQEDLNTLIV